jgi:hypothetical protein
MIPVSNMIVDFNDIKNQPAQMFLFDKFCKGEQSGVNSVLHIFFT